MKGKKEKKETNQNKGGVDFLAERMGVSVGAVYAAMRRGDPLPPCLQLGTRKIWRREVVERWVEEQEKAPKAARQLSESGARGGRPSARPRRGRPTKVEQIEGGLGGER